MISKINSLLSAGMAWVFTACSQPVVKPLNVQNTSPVSFYSFKMKDIDGNEIDFSQYKGKKALLVNVASECGNTPQYADLEKLHEQYGDKVTVLGFPANNFGKQEPGSSEEIKTFCKKNYGVKFTLFEKISVKGDDIAPLYQWLTDKSKNGWNENQPNWNFAKYLIDEKGELVAFFPAKTNPMAEEILSEIEK
ncbi:MAG TPA: glutathione peroxidase [Bacteroidia bacterium]|nr:glutathione peroxidase [Bacteroidia bacterium]